MTLHSVGLEGVGELEAFKVSDAGPSDVPMIPSAIVIPTTVLLDRNKLRFSRTGRN